MYQALLTRRYLTSKVMPLLSAMAVLLCTATVLIVWSIMGGFLDMLLQSGRTLIGDVSIAWPTAGFAYYDDLVQRLEKDAAIEAAAPTIETFGMLNLPDGRTEGVIIKGIDGASFAKVADYANSLWWKPISKATPKDKKGEDPRLSPDFADWAKVYQDGLRLKEIDPETKRERAAVVLGIEVTGFNLRRYGGWYDVQNFGVRREKGSLEWRSSLMINRSVTINVYPINRSSGRAADQVTHTLPVANEFKSGVYEIDSKTVYVELGELQRWLKMDAAAALKPGTDPGRYGTTIGPDRKERLAVPEAMGVDPARVTNVLVRAKKGATADEAAKACRAVYAQFAAAHPGEVPAAPGEGVHGAIVIQTWREREGIMVAAVEKEIVVMLIILMVVSITVTFMILAIFWAMISEKTKDIGVLRAIGAGRAGIAGMWLSYGLMIGVVGSMLGGLAACLIVWNINPIHEWLGNRLGVTVWDPKVYYFSEIPNHVQFIKALIVVVGGVVFSVLGALIPAWRAARMDPVRSLRFE